MEYDPKKEKIVNTEPEPVVNPANDKNVTERNRQGTTGPG